MATSDGDRAGPASGAGDLPAGLQERIAAPAEAIVRQGEPADRFYVILAGECEVVRDRGGRLQVLARLGPGHYFGETGLLAGVPRSATVVAVDEVRLASLGRDEYRAALTGAIRTSEELARRIYQVYGGGSR